MSTRRSMWRLLAEKSWLKTPGLAEDSWPRALASLNPSSQLACLVAPSNITCNNVDFYTQFVTRTSSLGVQAWTEYMSIRPGRWGANLLCVHTFSGHHQIQWIQLIKVFWRKTLLSSTWQRSLLSLPRFYGLSKDLLNIQNLGCGFILLSSLFSSPS